MIPPEYELMLSRMARRQLVLMGILLITAAVTLWFLPYAAMGLIFFALAFTQMFFEQLHQITGVRLWKTDILPATTVLALLLGLFTMTVQLVVSSAQLFLFLTQ
jgi:hypothetical protein